MKKSKDEVLKFKVDQAAGSIAIEGSTVSKEAKEIMVKIVRGDLSGEDERKRLIEKFSKKDLK